MCTQQLCVWLRPIQAARGPARGRPLDRQPVAGARDDRPRQGAAKRARLPDEAARAAVQGFELAELHRALVADLSMARPSSRSAISCRQARKTRRQRMATGPCSGHARARARPCASTNACISACSAPQHASRQQRKPRRVDPRAASAGIERPQRARVKRGSRLWDRRQRRSSRLGSVAISRAFGTSSSGRTSQRSLRARPLASARLRAMPAEPGERRCRAPAETARSRPDRRACAR